MSLYRLLNKRSKITASFVEHLEFQRKMTFREAFLVNNGKSKQKK